MNIIDEVIACDHLVTLTIEFTYKIDCKKQAYRGCITKTIFSEELKENIFDRILSSNIFVGNYTYFTFDLIQFTCVKRRDYKGVYTYINAKNWIMEPELIDKYNRDFFIDFPLSWKAINENKNRILTYFS